MKPMLFLLVAAAGALWLGSAGAESLKPRGHAKPAPQMRAAPSAPAGNMNVPSTDFSTIDQPGTEAHERSRGGDMRPAFTDSGQLGMGTGF
jgi:hypothetical protein